MAPQYSQISKGTAPLLLRDIILNHSLTRRAIVSSTWNPMVTNTSHKCPCCGAESEIYVNPLPTVDIIIEMNNHGILLIKRKNYPFGWAIPGGFVDYGESLEDAAIREAKEETGMDITLKRQLHTYSRPDRDPRHHAISTVYVAKALGTPLAADDAAEVEIFTEDTLPSSIAFDHREILADYFALKKMLK